MMKFFQRWDSFWCRDVPPHALALFRIALGLFLLIYAFPYLFKAWVFTQETLILPIYLDTAPLWLQPVLSPPSQATALVLFVLLLLALLSFTLGLRAQLSAVAITLLGLYFWQLQLHLFPNTYNRLFFFIMIVLCFAETDATFSLQNILHKKAFDAWEPISIFPQRFITLQTCATYFGVALIKVVTPAWHGGEILAYSFVTRWATAPAFWIAQQNWPIGWYDAFVAGLVVYELAMPFGLWIKKKNIRLWFMGAGALFHIGIAVLLAIWWFIAMIALYILFFDPEEVYAYLQRKQYVR